MRGFLYGLIIGVLATAGGLFYFGYLDLGAMTSDDTMVEESTDDGFSADMMDESSDTMADEAGDMMDESSDTMADEAGDMMDEASDTMADEAGDMMDAAEDHMDDMMDDAADDSAEEGEPTE